jgi:hypothetical protein
LTWPQFYVTSQEDLQRRTEAKYPAAKNGGLWIVWPKKASGVASDLSQAIVRKTGLATGLVDFKVAAIDATWSGLRFTQRQAGPQSRFAQRLRPNRNPSDSNWALAGSGRAVARRRLACRKGKLPLLPTAASSRCLWRD